MRYSLFFSLIFFYSCQFIDKKKLDSELFLENELTAFKWDELDQYPTFETCDENYNFEQNKICFESILSNHFIEFFKANNNISITKTTDTLIFELKVSKAGQIFISNSKSQFTIYPVGFIDLLQKSFLDLPILYPAIKRSQYVDSSFKLPVILNTKK